MESTHLLFGRTTREGFLGGSSFRQVRRLAVPLCWVFPLAVLCQADAGGLPISVQEGRLITSAPGAEVMLGQPYWFWEGGSSRFTVEQQGDDLTLLFHLDVANTAYWIDLQICQTPDGLAIVGSHSSGIWPDVCESYADWNDLLKHRDQPLAEIAVCCLQRCGMNCHCEPEDRATAVATN